MQQSKVDLKTKHLSNNKIEQKKVDLKEKYP